MLREDPLSITPERRPNANGTASTGAGDAARSGVDIQRELNRLEEIVLDSPRIPLSRRTLVDEEQLLEQLDLVRLNLPEAFHEAEAVARHKDEILHQAEQYAQEIIDQAERRAAQMINETGVLRQAELEAQQLRQQVQQECEAARDQTIVEIDHLRRQAQAELEEMQRQVIGECQDIQAGADNYADRVLSDMEMQLAEMLRVIRNGKQQLQSAQPEPLGRSHNPNSARQAGRGSRS
ncbi:MAG TPA: hypothetical protein V6D18_13470 [Thermosynechococcaceae cyanobacterium]